MITVEHARALGWQRVEFNDGLGFRPCTAVCAWNPEFQYREAGTSHVILDIDGTRVLCPPAYASTLYRNTQLTHKWYLNDHVFSVEPVFISKDVYRAVKIRSVRIDLCGAEVTYTVEEAKRHFTTTHGNTLVWYMPGGARIVNTNAFDHGAKGVFRAVRTHQIKFEDLPLDTTLRHKADLLRGVDYGFRGVDRSTGNIRAEWRSNDKVLLHSFPRGSVYLSPDQSWLPLGIDIPKGLMTIRHANGYWWRIVKLEEGYELV